MKLITTEAKEKNEQVIILGQVLVVTLGGGYKYAEGFLTLRMYAR